jgi:hypothetical protein
MALKIGRHTFIVLGKTVTDGSLVGLRRLSACLFLDIPILIGLHWASSIIEPAALCEQACQGEVLGSTHSPHCTLSSVPNSGFYEHAIDLVTLEMH